MFWQKKKKQVEETEQKTFYVLELHLDGVDSQDIPVEADLLVGSSEKAHIAIEGAELNAEHAYLKMEDGILSLQNMSEENSYIGEQKLQKGQSYILNHGDKVVLGKATFYIKKLGEEKSLEEKESAQLPPKEKKVEVKIPEPKAPEKAEKKEILIPEKKKKSFKLSHYSLESGPGFFLRLYALVTNIFIIYALLYTLFPLIDPTNAFFELLEQSGKELLALVPMPPELRDLFVVVVPYYFLYCTLEIFWALTLGISFPLILLGFRCDDSAIDARLKGVIREALGILTTPFLIFDFPILLGYRSLKEIVSRSYISSGSRFLKYVSAIILLPLLCLGSLFSSAFVHLDHFSTVEFDEEMTKEMEREVVVKKKKNVDLAATASETSSASLAVTASIPEPSNIVWQVNSEAFGVKADLNFKSDTLILPWKNKSIIILSTNNENYAELSPSGQLLLSSLISDADFGNPLFHLFFPHLKESLNSKTKLTTLNIDLENEFHHLLVGSQRLNKDMLNFEDPMVPLMAMGNFIIEFGPFLPGYLKVRDHFIELLGINEGASLSFLNQKVNNFIRISESAGKIRYILITSPELTHPSFDYRSVPQNKKVGFKIIKELLDGRWALPTPTVSASPSETKRELTQLEMQNAFAAIDFLHALKKNPATFAFDPRNILTFFRTQVELLKALPDDALAVKKLQASIGYFMDEIKALNIQVTPEATQFMGELELLQKRQLVAPAPTPTPTPEPTPTPTPAPAAKKKLKKKGY